nr:ABC transporter ATP-binding protein [Conexibacter arvalis]
MTIGGRRRRRTILRDVSLRLDAGRTLGLVGESGSGKSMTARSILRLLPAGARTEGTVRFDGASLPDLSPAQLRRVRAHEIAMVFQDPRAHVNPVRTIGDFLTEALVLNDGVAAAEARDRARAGLADVGLSEPDRRLDQHPHELSGGMLQRVMIAAALLARPRLLLADEPTTALDVTTQSEVMAIVDELRRELGTAMLFITHDLELAAAVCDELAVMYAGEIVERAPAAQLVSSPRHPYTAALLAARPSVERRRARMATVGGRPIAAYEAGSGCSFAPRCPHAEERCRTAQALRPLGTAEVRCCRAEELETAAAERGEEAVR